MLEDDKINLINTINCALRENLLLANNDIELVIKEIAKNNNEFNYKYENYEKLADKISNIINIYLISMTKKIYKLKELELQF